MLSTESFNRVVEQIKSHEGFRQYAYDDATGATVRAPKGKLTIGFGWNIQDLGCSEALACHITKFLLDKKQIELISNFPAYTELDDVRKAVLLDMVYNLGINGLMQFKNMLAAIERKDWITAGIAQLNSKWAEQVGNRAIKLNKMLVTGEWHEI